MTRVGTASLHAVASPPSLSWTRHAAWIGVLCAALPAGIARADDAPPGTKKDGPPPSEAPEVVVKGSTGAPPAPPPAPYEPERPPVDLAGGAPSIITSGTLRDGPFPTKPLGGVGSRDLFGPDWFRDTDAHDVNEIVRYLPSASSRPYNGAEASAPNFSMRGLPDDGLTEFIHVEIDGVPASPLPYGWTAFSMFPITPERIYGLDWVRGAHTVRYSPDTVGGVLNFLTRPVPDGPFGEVRAKAGSYGFTSVAGFGGTSWGPFGILLSAVSKNGDGFRRESDWSQFDGSVKMRWDLGCGDWLSVAASYMEDEHRSPGGLTQAQYDADRFDNSRLKNGFDGYRAVADAVWHRDFGGCGWFEAFGWWSLTHRHLLGQDEVGPPVNLFNWNDDTYVAGVGLRGERTFWVGGCAHTIHAGIRYERDRLPDWKIRQSDFLLGGAETLVQDTEGHVDAFSLHVDDTFKPFCRLTVNAGARMEWIPNAGGSDPILGFTFDETFFRVLPGVGLSYELTPCWAVYGNYYEGFRCPQVWGFPYANTAAGLDFETARSAEVGTRVQHACGVSAELTAYRVEFDDYTTFDTGFYENFGRIVTWGGDLTAEVDLGRRLGSLDGLTLFGSFTLQDPKLQEGAGKGNQVPYAPKTKASWRLRYARCGWDASIGGTYVGDTFSDELNTEAAAPDGTIGKNAATALWDARIGKTFSLGNCTSFEVAAGATNLFDKEWFVHSRGGFFGSGLVAGAPFQVYGSLAFTLDF